MQDSVTDNGNHDHACAIGENVNADVFSIGAVHLIIVILIRMGRESRLVPWNNMKEKKKEKKNHHG